jgi:hypothetical protein
MLKNQQFPGEGDGSNVNVTTRHVNTSGGSSKTLDYHQSNRGVSGPASFQGAVDDSAEVPLHVQQVHLDPHSLDVLEVLDHDNHPAPESLPSPGALKKSVTKEATATGMKPAPKVSTGVRTKTVGKIGG